MLLIVEVVFSILFVQLVTAYVVANPLSPYNAALLEGAHEHMTKIRCRRAFLRACLNSRSLRIGAYSSG